MFSFYMSVFRDIEPNNKTNYLALPVKGLGTLCSIYVSHG